MVCTHEHQLSALGLNAAQEQSVVLHLVKRVSYLASIERSLGSAMIPIQHNDRFLL